MECLLQLYLEKQFLKIVDGIHFISMSISQYVMKKSICSKKHTIGLKQKLAAKKARDGKDPGLKDTSC